MEFKLGLAQRVDYPFIVVSFDEIKSLDEQDSLIILDGIIGQFIARTKLREIAERMMNDTRDYYDSLPEDMKAEYLQDMACAAETEAELQYDPIVKAAATYESKAMQAGVSGYAKQGESPSRLI